MDKSIIDAIDRQYPLDSCENEYARMAAYFGYQLRDKEVEVLTDELLKTAEKYGCASKQLQQQKTKC